MYGSVGGYLPAGETFAGALPSGSYSIHFDSFLIQVVIIGTILLYILLLCLLEVATYNMIGACGVEVATESLSG